MVQATEPAEAFKKAPRTERENRFQGIWGELFQHVDFPMDGAHYDGRVPDRRPKLCIRLTLTFRWDTNEH